MAGLRGGRVSRRGDAGSAYLVLGVVALVLFLVAMLVVIVGLAFSVKVEGHSMEPTLHDGDRLEVDLLHRHDVNRFDLVEAIEPQEKQYGTGQAIVKRVIGLPGDQVSVTGKQPVVRLKKAGSSTVYVVDNPAWTPRIGANTKPCCTSEGRSNAKSAWVTIPAHSYWVIGDNWGASTDSRVFGFVPEKNVKAKLSFRIQPLGRFGHIANPVTLAPAR